MAYNPKRMHKPNILGKTKKPQFWGFFVHRPFLLLVAWSCYFSSFFRNSSVKCPSFSESRSWRCGCFLTNYWTIKILGSFPQNQGFPSAHHFFQTLPDELLPPVLERQNGPHLVLVEVFGIENIVFELADVRNIEDALLLYEGIVEHRLFYPAPQFFFVALR